MPSQIGGIFPENIHGGHNKRSFRFHIIGRGSYILRMIVVVILFIAAMGILTTRLFELTIIKGKYYQELSQGNRTRERKIVAPRGIIYDRNGQPLVHNIPKSGGDITREYTYGAVFSHALGYIGEISPEELRQLNSNLPDSLLYFPGDAIGKSGVEQYYEERLRGIDGKKLIEVDAKGAYIGDLGRVDPKPGQNINLSLDLDLQKIASNLLSGQKGAIIATVPQTGEVLTLYSSPSFDPNQLIRGENVNEILQSIDMPLFDRAIGGAYPPGSTFKIVAAIAALESGAITPSTQVEDVGVLEIGQFRFPNWYFNQYGKKEGMVDIVKAIKRSNDIFFYKAAEAVGIERLSSWAKKMGLGERLGIDLTGEEKGVVPDVLWKEKVKGEKWFLGDTYHMAIGQGDLLTTPLQVNSWTNLVANGGKFCRPHLLKIQNPLRRRSGQAKSKDANEECKDLGLKKETIDLVREGMKEACSPGGTGWPLFKFKIQNSKIKTDGLDFLQTEESTTSGKPMVEIPTACKTGTAEYGDPAGKTHAWFTIFAPVYNPQISVTVLVEGGGEGSNVAAPMAKKMLEEWFGR